VEETYETPVVAAATFQANDRQTNEQTKSRTDEQRNRYILPSCKARVVFVVYSVPVLIRKT